MDKATKIARVTAIREHALRILREHGQWEMVSGTRELGATFDGLKMLYRTPFQPLPLESELLRYQRARVGGKANLPYGLDIWIPGKKVLNLEWSDDGALEIISFKPGDWERTLGPGSGGVDGAGPIAAEDLNARKSE